MTPWGRAATGAVFGAFVTLAVHPVSRPYFQAAFEHPRSLTAAIARNLDTSHLPPPSNPTNAAEWLRIAAEKLESGTRLTAPEYRTLLAICEESSGIDEDNAYWPQMRAVLLSRMGRSQEALTSWIRASNCGSWDDYQSSRLLRERDRIVRSTGWDQAWTYGVVFFDRSDAAAAQIQRYAQELVAKTTVDSADGLRVRYATIQNGVLLRQGSRSIKVGAYGWRMVELASYPPSMSGVRGQPKRIWLAETTLTSRLRQEGLVEEARHALDAFNNNEAWLALTGEASPDSMAADLRGRSNVLQMLTQDQSPEDYFRDLCLTSIVLSALPGAMIFAAVLGALLFAGSTLLQERIAAKSAFPRAALGAAALILGGGVLWSTHLWSAAVSVALCVLFLGVGPQRPRSRKSDQLGPLYTFVLFALWSIASAAIGLYVISTSEPAVVMSRPLGPAGEYLADWPLFLAVGLIVLSLVCLVAPFWATVRRFGTPDLLVLTLRRMGLMGAGMCLGVCVLGAPLVVFGDRLCSSELSRIVRNEPVYYLSSPQ